MSERKDPGAGLNGAVAAEMNGARTAAGLTFQELADRSGVSAWTLKRYAHGERHIPVRVLGLVAGVCGVSVGELLRRAEDRLAGEEA